MSARIASENVALVTRKKIHGVITTLPVYDGIVVSQTFIDNPTTFHFDAENSNFKAAFTVTLDVTGSKNLKFVHGYRLSVLNIDSSFNSGSHMRSDCFHQRKRR